MSPLLLEKLAPVRRRQFWLRVARDVLIGLACGIAVCVAALAGHRLGGPAGLRPLALAALLVSPVIGAVLAAIRRPNWADAAQAVDATCDLKDRATAALEFSACSEPTNVQRLQVADALKHLNEVDARQAVPWPAPRRILAACTGGLGVAALLAFAFLAEPPSSALAVAPGDLAEILELLDQSIKEVDSAAKEHDCAALRALAAQIRAEIEALKQPGLDVCEAMTKISALQAKLAEMLKEFDTAQVDRALKDLGGAMAGAKPLEPAAKALNEGQYSQAAKAIEKAASEKMDPKEGRAAEEKMKEAARTMQKKNLPALSQATRKLAEGAGGDKDKMQQGAKELTDELRKQERRKRINELMARQQQQLSDCKSQCEQLARNLMQSRQQQQQQKPGQGQQQQAAAGGADGKNASRPTKFATNKQELKGQANDGPSDVVGPGDSRHEPDARTNSPNRVNAPHYKRFKEMSEQAMLDEHIPLSMRQIIRQYFEGIRPAVDKPAAPPK